jgi:hypothetical protein
MKTVSIPAQANEVNALLEEARQQDLLVCAADGTEFLLTATDDFDHESARTRHNAKLMALLDERAKQVQTVSLDEVEKQLGLRHSEG